MNLYGFALNDPINLLDFLGFDPIGYVYHIRGIQHGEAVNYVGSARVLRSRFNKHQWKELINSPDTKIDAYEVDADIDISKSNKGTERSAFNEALRAPEQKVLDNVAKNKEKILNKRRAALPKNVRKWMNRHNVKIKENAIRIKNTGKGLAIKGVGALALIDIYMMYCDEKKSQYVFAPYVLKDNDGYFTMGFSRENWIEGMNYHKSYISGNLEGNTVFISKDQFEIYKQEAEALWGRLDWKMDFVPGLLNNELDVTVNNRIIY